MSRKIVRRGKSYLQKLLSIVKEFRLVARSLIEVMKKGKDGGGGWVWRLLHCKKKVTDFSVPSRLPAGKN